MEEICVVCKKNPVQQKHHLSYRPPLIIDICVPCHLKLHKSHGVGNPKGFTKYNPPEHSDLDDYFDDVGSATIYNKKENLVYSRETGEKLWSIACGCKRYGNGIYLELWRVFTTDKDKRGKLYLKCMQCGRDSLIKLVKEDA